MCCKRFIKMVRLKCKVECLVDRFSIRACLMVKWIFPVEASSRLVSCIYAEPTIHFFLSVFPSVGHLLRLPNQNHIDTIFYGVLAQLRYCCTVQLYNISRLIKSFNEASIKTT